jgi:UDP-glucose 4-epimerase
LASPICYRLDRVTPTRVLVLGGTGFIGRSIVRRFSAAGWAVRVLARNAVADAEIDGAVTVEYRTGDASAPDDLEGSLENVDHVVYAVGRSLPQESNQDPVTDLLITVPPLLILLEALRATPAIGLTYLSSGGTVYGNPDFLPASETSVCAPITGYGISKLASEKYIGMYSKLYGVHAQILRVANAYGPGQRAGRSQGVIASLFDCLLHERTAKLFGNAVRDYLFVDDIAEAVFQLQTSNAGTVLVNVGSGVGSALSEVISTIETVTGATILRNQLPARDFDVHEIVLDVSRLRSLIDWRPRPLMDGIRATWDSLGVHSAVTELTE